MDKEKSEELKNKIMNSKLNVKLKEACCRVFESEIQLENATHADIVEWFTNYLSSTILLYQIFMINIMNQAMQKESGAEMSEFIKDFNEIFEFMNDFKKLLEENSEQK